MSHNSSAEDKQAIWGPSCPRTPFPAKLILSLDWPLRVTSILRPCQPHRGLPPTIRTLPPHRRGQAGLSAPFLGQSPGPSPSPPRPRPPLIFPSLQGAPSLVIHPRFLRRCDFPASQPSGYPALDGRWLPSLSWPPPCLGNVDIRGADPLRRGLIPYSPSLTPALQRPCLCRGTRLSWRPSFRPKGPLPPSLWGAGGGEGGGWLPSVPVASFPCFSGPVPPQLPVLFKAAPGTSASLSPRAAHHAEPRRPAVCFGSTLFLNMSRGMERNLSTLRRTRSRIHLFVGGTFPLLPDRRPSARPPWRPSTLLSLSPRRSCSSLTHASQPVAL